jgi:hypothetical protein
MTKAQGELMARLVKAGITWDDADALRRIAMTLHRWAERECGDDHGCISRDEDTNIPYWKSAWGRPRYRIPDRETGALKRLHAIMARYPGWVAYHQGDPRGAALYLIPPDRVRPGQEVDRYYSDGIAVY